MAESLESFNNSEEIEYVIYSHFHVVVYMSTTHLIYTNT